MTLVYFVGIYIDSSILLKCLALHDTVPHPETFLQLFPITFKDPQQIELALQYLENVKPLLNDSVAIQLEYSPDNTLILQEKSLNQVLQWRNKIYEYFDAAGLVRHIDTFNELPIPSFPINKKHQAYKSDLVDQVNESAIIVDAKSVLLYSPAATCYIKPPSSFIALEIGVAGIRSTLDLLSTEKKVKLIMPFLPLSIESEEQMFLAKKILIEMAPYLVDLTKRDPLLGKNVKHLEWEPKILVNESKQSDDAYLVPTFSSLMQFHSWYKLLHQRFGDAQLLQNVDSSWRSGMRLSKTRTRLFAVNDMFDPGDGSPCKSAVSHISLRVDGNSMLSISPRYHGDIPKDNLIANMIHLLTSNEFWHSPQQQPLTKEIVFRLTHTFPSFDGFEWTTEMVAMFVDMLNPHKGLDGKKIVIDLPVDDIDNTRPLTLFCIASLYAKIHNTGVTYGYPTRCDKYSRFALLQFLRGFDCTAHQFAKVLEARCGSPVIQNQKWCLPSSCDPLMVSFFNQKTTFSLLQTHDDNDWCIKVGLPAYSANVILINPECDAKYDDLATRICVRRFVPPSKE